MDNAQKAIMIGVGLFITIIIIAAVMLITGMGQDMINSSTSQVSNISSSLQAQLTSQYDETVLTGSQVISAVKANNTTEGMVIVVDNGSGTTGITNYGRSVVDGNFSNAAAGYKIAPKIKENSSQTAIGKLTDANSSSTYVPSTGKFNAHLIKISDTVVGIYFEKK